MLGLQGTVDGEAVAASALPPDLRNPAPSDLEDTAGRLVVRIAAEVANERRNVLLLCTGNQRCRGRKIIMTYEP